MIEAVRPHATPELQAAMQTLLKNTLLAAPTEDHFTRVSELVDAMHDRGLLVALLDGFKGDCGHRSIRSLVA